LTFCEFSCDGFLVRVHIIVHNICRYLHTFYTVVCLYHDTTLLRRRSLSIRFIKNTQLSSIYCVGRFFPKQSNFNKTKTNIAIPALMDTKFKNCISHVCCRHPAQTWLDCNIRIDCTTIKMSFSEQSSLSIVFRRL